MKLAHGLFGTTILMLSAGLRAGAQQTVVPPLDRSIIPKASAPATFKMPAYAIDTLSNGARLVVVERHGLPIVNITIHFSGGASALGTKPAVASFLSGMTRAGTESRSIDRLASELTLLDAVVAIGANPDGGAASLSGVVGDVDRAMDLMMDMMLHSTYPAGGLEVLRAQALAGFRSGQGVAATIANQAASRLLFGDLPSGHVVTEADINAVTSGDIAELARKMFIPVNATVYVVGDMTRAQAREHLERAFRSWPRSGLKISFHYPRPPAPAPTTIFVVDLPDATQSFVRLTRPLALDFGPAMAHLDVANYILGTGLQSRLSLDIRQTHRYSYGFNSGLAWQVGSGAFSAAGNVFRDKSDSALLQAIGEIRGIAGERPATDSELRAAKTALTQPVFSALQSNAGVTAIVSRLVDEGLSRDWWTRYIATVNATSAADVTAAAKTNFDPDHLVIVVAGDRARIVEALRGAGIGPVVQVDRMGKRIAPSPSG